MAMSVDAKLLKQTKFPVEFNQKVDMKKVNVEVMKKFVLYETLDSDLTDTHITIGGLLAKYRRYSAVKTTL